MMVMSFWWGCLDLNQGPIDYESTALTAELHPPRRSCLPASCRHGDIQHSGAAPLLSPNSSAWFENSPLGYKKHYSIITLANLEPGFQTEVQSL